MAALIGFDGENGTRRNDIIVGTGLDDRTFGGGDGDDFLVSLDARVLVVNAESPRHDRLRRAIDLDDPSQWVIMPGVISDTPDVPRRVIVADGVGASDYYAVTIGAGETITLDIDAAFDFQPGSLDAVLELRDARGRVLSFNDDLSPADDGSVGTKDPYLVFTAETAETYYVHVGAATPGSQTVAPIPRGLSYLLNIAVTGHDNDGAIMPRSAVRTVSGDNGNDTIYGGVTTDILFGGTANDRLFGGAGDDQIDGGSGDDIAVAGDGDDIVYVAEIGGAFDRVDGGGGDDRLDLASSPGSGWTINALAGRATSSINDRVDFAGIESFQGGDGDDVFTAGFGTFSLFGGAGTDMLDIRAFSTPSIRYEIDLQNGTTNYDDLVVDVEDFISGGSVDIVAGSDAGNWISTGAGADEVNGGRGNDRLDGGDGDDALNGGAGADVIIGGLGSDQMTGGRGADRFVFVSGDTSNFSDFIADFSRAQGDRIDLSEYDAIPGTDRLDRFRFIGTDAFSGRAGELRYFVTETNTFVTADLNGDRDEDFIVQLAGPLTLTQRDFILKPPRDGVGGDVADAFGADRTSLAADTIAPAFLVLRADVMLV